MRSRTRRHVRAAGRAASDRHAPEAARGVEGLDALHARAEARAASAVPSDGWAAHEAVLDRLAANIRVAQARGWSSCAIERIDSPGRFSAWGVPPGDCERHAVPDWAVAAR